MVDNIKDFIILCINNNKKIVQLHIKNMPDSDERKEIYFIKKKVEHLFKIFKVLTFSIALVCFIVCCIWIGYGIFWFFGLVCSILLLTVTFARCFVPVKKILRKHFVKKEKCDFLRQYLEDYSNGKWNCLERKVEKAYSILNLICAKTPEGILLCMDPQNSAGNILINFSKTYFEIDWVSYTQRGDLIHNHERFNTGNIIKNYMLEKDTVEFDFMKNELRVPLEFKIIDNQEPSRK